MKAPQMPLRPTTLLPYIFLIFNYLPQFYADDAKLSAGLNTNYAIEEESSKLMSSGRDDFGQLGRDGTLEIPELVSSDNLVKVVSGEGHVIALTSTGNVLTWGQANYGQAQDSDIPVIEPSLFQVVDIAAGAFSSYALDVNGDFWSKGRNHLGQLGLGDTSDRSTWTKVNLPSGDLTCIDAGIEHVLLVISGNIHGFGSDGFNQLTGIESGNHISTPSLIDNTTTWTSVHAGGHHSFSIDATGNAYAWGKNSEGQLALDSSVESIATIEPVTALSNVTSISAGYAHSLFHDQFGLWGAGRNEEGQLGVTGQNYYYNPVVITTPTPAIGMTAGPYQSLVRLDSQDVFATGQIDDSIILSSPSIWLRQGDVQILTLQSLILTEENGNDELLEVFLNESPTGGNSVQLNVTIEPAGVATVSPSTLTFDETQWNVPQNIFITPLDDGIANYLTAQVNISIDGSSDSLFLSAEDKLVPVERIDDDSESLNVFRGGPSDNLATPIQIAATLDAEVYESDLTAWTGSWEAPHALYDQGPFQDDPYTWSTNVDVDQASTWSLNSPPAGEGVLVIDMKQVRHLESFSVFQMFSDGKTTHIELFEHPETSDAAPDHLDPAWTSFTDGLKLLTEGVSNSDNVSSPLIFNASATTRYVKIHASNDGRYGDPDYIELKGIKAFTHQIPHLIFSEISLSIEEGASGDFEVSLGAAPSNGANVVIDITDNNPGEISFTPTSLIFTPDNWSTPQTVSIVSNEDSNYTEDETGLVFSVDPSESDSSYTVLPTMSVNILITNNDFADSQVMQFSTYTNHSMFLRSDNTLWATGYNVYGQLSDSTTTNQSSPLQVSSNVLQVSAGQNHTLFIKNDHTLWAVGYNANGQLGVGDTTNRTTPVQVMTDVAQVSCGSSHTMIIKTDGTLWGTGYNGNGQLGNGGTTNQLSPIQVMTDVSKVYTGLHNTLFIKTDGTLWGIGFNSSGQLGIGNTTNQATPVQISSNVLSASTSHYHSMFIKDDNSLWSMGQNSYGELADGTTINQTSPIQVMSDVSSVELGRYHSLIIKTDNSLWTVGYNGYGELGDGTIITQSTPVQLMSDVAQVEGGDSTTFILRNDGAFFAIGYNFYGQLGVGSNTDLNIPTQILFPEPVSFGNAMYFDGSTYVTIPDNGSLDLVTSFTIEAWINTDDLNDNTIVDKGNYKYLFQTHDNLRFYNTSIGWKSSTGTFSIGQWVHAAVVFDEPTDSLKFYLDGVLQSTFNSITSVAADDGDINIGRQEPSSCQCNFFNGTMDELRMWNVARSQSEIQTYMNQTLTGDETGLQAYWNFDESSGSAVGDSSSNGNDGTIIGNSNFVSSGVPVP